MEVIRGKNASFMDSSAFAERLSGYDSIFIDIGTGDGRFVQHLAQTHPDCFVIGIDACRENLHEVSRRAPSNALLVIANAQALPVELSGLGAQITINFPWGSLLEGLLMGNMAMLDSLIAIARPDARLEVRLNAGALAELDWSLEAGGERVRDVLTANGFDMQWPITLSARDLKAYPTTWAKRLAFGRDPRAAYLHGLKQDTRTMCTAYPMTAAELESSGQHHG
jgi:16S rRNA (adenine(1408)-N(1))-methyltransferase